MKSPFLPALFLLILMLLLMACRVPGLGQTPAGNPPSAAIASPATNQSVNQGETLQIKSVSVDEQGVVRVELVVDGTVILVDANADPQPNTPFIVQQPWTATEPGAHNIFVRAFNRDNQAGESESITMQVVAAETAAAATATPVPAATSTLASGSDSVASLGDAATATPPPPATSTLAPVPPPSHTPAPVTATHTPTITPTPSATPAPEKFDPTGLEPDGRFKDIWQALGAGDSRLGYPTGPEIIERDYARQPFERGLMVWWDNPQTPDYIWVIDSPSDDLSGGKTSNLYPDTWSSDQPEVACEAAKDGGPVRGFGKVWCDHAELQPRLGKPTEAERGSGGSPPFAVVQFYQGGAMLYIPHTAEVFVLFAQGDWQRFIY